MFYCYYAMLGFSKGDKNERRIRIEEPRFLYDLDAVIVIVSGMM